MKWKGTVSHSAKTTIAARFRRAKMPQATSIQRKPRFGQGQRSGRVNPVSLAANRLDGLTADLGAEPADVDVDHIGSGIEAIAPDGLEQPLLAHGVARTGHQLAQEQELPLRQQHPPGLGLDLVSDQVEGQRTGRQACAHRTRVAQAGPDPGQQLFKREGLDQVVVSARFEGGDLRWRIAERGQDDYRLARMLADKAAQDLDAAEVGQEKVEDDQVVGRPERRLEARVAVRRKVDREAFPAQPARNEIADTGLVIYKKDAGGRLSRCHHAAGLSRKRTSWASRSGSMAPAHPARWNPFLSTR